ncbi:MAG: hypothetical protein IK141_03885 [Clostridia bacterium]|nr:hypothetical protein [Clostridia bacterium]
MEECGLYLGKNEIGRLRWSRSGETTTLFAACPVEKGRIYRVVLLCEGEQLPLGVMLPDGGKFVLKKTLPRTVVPQRALVDRSLPGEGHLPGLPLAYSAFQQAEAKGLKVPEAAAKGLLCADWIDRRYYLAPFCPGEESAFASYFSLSVLIEGETGGFLAFCEKDGNFEPVFSKLLPKQTDFAELTEYHGREEGST